MSIELISRAKCFDGEQRVYRHSSNSTGTPMDFAVFMPAKALAGEKCPVLVYLSGLTCTWENVTFKGGAQMHCAKTDLIFVAPDTSPRGTDVANDDAYDLGQGAGFYLDSTELPWAKHFKMESYIADELHSILLAEFPVDSGKVGVTGHSMGGHGALTLALKHPQKYKSVSAFSPITNPMDCPWGEKAFTTYLGTNQEMWKNHDACNLAKSRGWQGDILVDQGQDDEFLREQLKIQNFDKACQEAGIDLNLRMHAGYDHSYYFISTFMQDHIAWHSERLNR